MVLNASNVNMAHVTLGKKINKSTQSVQLKINCQWARTLPCSGKIMVVGDQPHPHKKSCLRLKIITAPHFSTEAVGPQKGAERVPKLKRSHP